ncbi:hypothetical protein CNO13_07340 (plasmid) [Borrelia miyamotoi]|uniref:Uncharacterized protein n=1 Tax=Borrelia miyamotoi TaxID=47466 RepID=A0ABY7VN14_9SPIR|nr:hypothetical protein [Borrelia miyamotoi]WCL22195.1 hypothetical protein CNO10_07435 [Borrelia miyamotoi]WDE71793.1 hypothetical protein CNO13_07340 [Borrelia miyamotoi]WDS47349.1 hypothetical protein EZU72_007725 [Borrelia miyamotoi]WDS49182.1 hypothetical protein EZU71_008045 [Borrelia miyamotoi]WEG99689.1 hypothetical protein EZU69_007485 [Borrelia miyamotoi]
MEEEKPNDALENNFHITSACCPSLKLSNVLSFILLKYLYTTCLKVSLFCVISLPV